MPSRYSEEDRKLFAEELKAMRIQRGWTQEELAQKINFSSSTVSNIESGHRAPTEAQAAAIDAAFGAPGTFVRLERRIRGLSFSSGFRPFEPYEKTAVTLRVFEHTLIPGLFQTEDYARTILETYPESAEQVVQERVDLRLARQAILSRKDPPPPHIWALLDEQVLRRNVGGPAAMYEQIKHLAELGRMQRIHIQVIPADRPHPGLQGAFALAEMDHPPVIVYLERASDGQTVEDAATSETMTLLFDALRMEALSGGTSLKMIDEAVQRWKTQIET
jgi:transcriptional regulator with XRE-family HTH domain